MKTQIRTYNNMKLNRDTHVQYLDAVFGIQKGWSTSQVNPDGSFFFRMSVPAAFKASGLTKDKAVKTVRSFVSHFQQRIDQIAAQDKNAAYLTNLFKYMKFRQALPFKLLEHQHPNHYEVFFDLSLPSVSKAGDVDGFIPVTSFLQDAYIKFIVGENRVFGLDYSCPVFTESLLETIETDGDSLPRKVTYYYHDALYKTTFIVYSEIGEIIYVSDKRTEDQRIFASDQNRFQSASVLLYFPDDEQPTTLVS